MKRMNEINNGFWVCLFMWTVLHILSGCTQTEVVDEPQLPQGGKEVQATFHLNVLANRDSQTRSIAFTADGTIETDFIPASPKDTVKTKAADQLPEGEDSRIAHLWIGQRVQQHVARFRRIQRNHLHERQHPRVGSANNGAKRPRAQPAQFMHIIL